MANADYRQRRKTILKKRVDREFSHIPNATLQDPRLSWKSTGLLSFLLSMPDDWEISLEDLRTRKMDGRDSTRSAISELETAGYMRITPLRDPATGKFTETVWEVSAAPDFLTVPDSENPKTVKPVPVEPGTDKPLQQRPLSKGSSFIDNNHNAVLGSCCSDLNEEKVSCQNVGPRGQEKQALEGEGGRGLDLEPLSKLGESILPAKTLSTLVEVALETPEPQAYLDLIAVAYTTPGRTPPDKPIRWLEAVIKKAGGGDLTPAYRFRIRLEQMRLRTTEQRSLANFPLVISAEQRVRNEKAVATGLAVIEKVRAKLQREKIPSYANESH